MAEALDMANGITGVSSTGFIDYLSFTLPKEIDLKAAVESLLEINFDNFSMATTGRNGYHSRYTYGNIDVLTDGGSAGMGHHITLTGKACHQLHDRLPFIAAQVFGMSGHFTRCDLTIDELAGLLDMDEILQAITGGRVISSMKKIKDYSEYNKITGQLTGRAAYFGSRKSDVYIRIYDKALEQRADHHWIRVEVELKDGKADAALKLIPSQGIGALVRGIIKKHLSFREQGKGSNRSRWPISSWWEMFLGCVEKLQLASRTHNPASQEGRLAWFMSNSATFAELIDTIGFAVIPMMYADGKQKLASRGTF